VFSSTAVTLLPLMTPPLASVTVPTSEVLFAICARRNNGLNGRKRQAMSAFFMVGSYYQLLAGQENYGGYGSAFDL
jgi:hypothetical protein